MCRKSSAIPISHGQDKQYFLYCSHLTWVACFLPLISMTMILPYCAARASDMSTGRLITEVQRQESESNEESNEIEDEWQQIYIGRSGDPWGGMSVQQEESIHSRIPPLNFTYNNSNDDQMPIRRQDYTHSRSKRGVVHLYNMVVCATGCNPLAYKGYGCYCGFLGSGYVIDGIDKCCKMHDWCYDATDCPMFSEYFVPYYWKCYHGYKPICAVEHGDWGGSGSCSQRLCECDRSLAECLRRFPCPTTKAMCTSSPWRLVQNLFMTM